VARCHLTAHRLFRYRLTRHSYRQGRWMEFAGIVGWLEWEGAVDMILPWLYAAQFLHVGQKATFGFGRLEIVAASG
jgi:CRISPR/Cas system endoribonuclease Cas6 (RAMP superfamily)